MKKKLKPVDPTTAAKALEKDADIIARRAATKVQRGEILTERERDTLLEIVSPKGAAEAGGFARNQAEAAKALGVSRQKVQYHCRHYPEACGVRADGRIELRALRERLTATGRTELLPASAGRSTRRDSHRELVEDATLAQFYAISNTLPQAIANALKAEGVAITSQKLDSAVVSVWFMLASAQSTTAERQGITGALDGEQDGEHCEYPQKIREIAGRLSPD